MRDLETVLAAIGLPSTRAHAADAVNAFRAGAYRASILSIWVTVTLDIIAKARVLAEEGDAACIALVDRLDKAMSAGDVKSMQKIENELLDFAAGLELLRERDRQSLDRLAFDRNLCAHPAFLEPGEAFSPSAELTRAHIVEAVDALLAHPPTPGRRVVERLMREIVGSGWPVAGDGLGEYLRVHFFSNQRSTAQAQVAKLVLKSCLAPPDDLSTPTLRARLRSTANAIAQVAPQVFETALADVVDRKERLAGLSADEMRAAVATFGSMDVFWSVLPPASHPKAIACIRDSSDEDLLEEGLFAFVTCRSDASETVAATLDQRLQQADDDLLQAAIEHAAVPRVASVVAGRIAASQNFAATNRWMPAVVALHGSLSLDDLKGLVDAAATNSQIRHAFESDRNLEELFQLTRTRLSAMQAWKPAADALKDDGKTRAYPRLALAVGDA